MKIYPVEADALREALIAVGSPAKLPGWYDSLAQLSIRIDREMRRHG